MILSTEQGLQFKSKTFCFETSWLKHHDFIPKVKEIWEKPILNHNAIDTWTIKIKRVKKFLTGWGKSLRGHTRKYKNILQDELLALELLEEVDSLPSHLLDKKTFIQSELLKLMEEEELYWHKRSNSNWLLRGDNNNGFFHRVANEKKRKNTIFSLHHEDNIIEDDKLIIEHATQYYKNLFGPSDRPNTHLDPNC